MKKYMLLLFAAASLIACKEKAEDTTASTDADAVPEKT